MVFVRDIRAGQFEWVSDTWISQAKANELHAHTVRPGDVVVTKMGLPPGISAVYPQDMPAGIVTADIIRIRPDVCAVRAEWLSLALNAHHAQRQVAAITGGVTRPKITLQDFRQVRIPVPPLAEQRRIAEILASVDESIRSTEHLIAKLRTARNGFVADLLSKGISESGRLRDPVMSPNGFVATRLGLLPASWRIGQVGAACSLVIDCPHSTPRFVRSGVLVARTFNIRNGAFSCSRASFVSEDEYRERISRAEPTVGDVIFTREAPVGEAFSVPLGMRICLGQRVMLLRPDCAALDSQYLVAQIYSGFVRERIDLLTAGTTNPHLNVADLKKILIPLPPLREQREIGLLISRFDEPARAAELELEKLELLKCGLTEDLLTGRVRAERT
ncbi:MAG: restriction endonuclease subunit S [Micromonosporaceae bacterium]|nr:restriction endonuclease subunit S [Micromonosporaceae bacterium]